MSNAILFALLGYLSGSVFYSQVACRLFHVQDVTTDAADHNPGVYNAFVNGGLAVGAFALAGDLLKGALPVFLWRLFTPDWQMDPALPLVLAGPVLGTLFPLFRHFSGGKGIAVCFSVLLGLVPVWDPVLLLAACFIFFSVVIVVDSHYFRTLATFVCFLFGVSFLSIERPIVLSCQVIALVILVNLALKRQEAGALEVHLLWKH